MKVIFYTIIIAFWGSFSSNIHPEPWKFWKKKPIKCSEYTEKYVDKLTGIKRYIATEKINILDYNKEESFDLIWFKTKEEYTLAVKSTSKFCFQNDIAVSFHLLQGKVITIPSSHISNCESLMTVHLDEDDQNSSNKLDLLASSEVVGISFDNKKTVYKLKLHPDQSLLFLETVKCLRTN